VGWRGGTRCTAAVTWDAAAGDYRMETIDEPAGCANAMKYTDSAGREFIVAANREIDEIARYQVE
jgi:hypothetical protein